MQKALTGILSIITVFLLIVVATINDKINLLNTSIDNARTEIFEFKQGVDKSLDVYRMAINGTVEEADALRMSLKANAINISSLTNDFKTWSSGVDSLLSAQMTVITGLEQYLNSLEVDIDGLKNIKSFID